MKIFILFILIITHNISHQLFSQNKWLPPQSVTPMENQYGIMGSTVMGPYLLNKMAEIENQYANSKLVLLKKLNAQQSSPIKSSSRIKAMISFLKEMTNLQASFYPLLDQINHLLLRGDYKFKDEDYSKLYIDYLVQHSRDLVDDDENKQSIYSNSANANSYYNLGNLKLKINDYSGAIKEFDKSIILKPNFEDALIKRGYAKSEIGDFEGAILDYDKVIYNNPNSEYAYVKRGDAKDEQGDSQGAIQDYNKAIEINPKNSNIYYNRALVKYKIGDTEGALEDYSNTIELNPKDASAYNNRGVARYKIGDKNGACFDWNRAKDLGNLKADNNIIKFCK
jgi:tetratricopeptide (TPR) repeat protein